MTRSLLVSALVLASSACRVAPPLATAVDAERGQVALVELQHGRKLMVTKCGNCHKPPMPADEPVARWPATLEVMAERAGLDTEQRRLIQQYFVVMATR